MKITDSHEWVKKEGSIATIGITEKAGTELGSIVYIELPKIGDIVKQGDETAILESTKAASDTYAPVSGKVIEINADLEKSPHLVNEDPQGTGWLYKLEISVPSEYDLLKNLE